MAFPDIPSGFAIPLVNLLTKLLPADTMAALDARYASTDTGWVEISTFATGWAAVSADKPRVRRVGNRVDLTGSLTRSAGELSNLFTIPTGFRLTGPYTTVNVGAGVSSNNIPLQFAINADVHRFSIRGTPANPATVYLQATWYVD